MKRYVKASTGGIHENYVAPTSDYYHRRYGYQYPKAAFKVDKDKYIDQLANYSPEIISYVSDFFNAHPRAYSAVVKDINLWSDNPATVAVAELRRVFKGEKYVIDGDPYYPIVSAYKEKEDGTIQLNLSVGSDYTHTYSSESATNFISHVTGILNDKGVNVIDSSYQDKLSVRPYVLKVKFILD